MGSFGIWKVNNNKEQSGVARLKMGEATKHRKCLVSTGKFFSRYFKLAAPLSLLFRFPCSLPVLFVATFVRST